MHTVEPWIQTHSGEKFWITDPKPETIDINDIAHSLAMQCRYNGHAREHYSVAQHSIIVSHMVPCQYALAGLLHDAAEAYVGDQTKPYKDLVESRFSDYIEHKITVAIFDKFNVTPYHFDCPEIIEADLAVLRSEALQVLSNPPIDDWHIDLPKRDILISCWDWKTAKELFLMRFNDLI